jgi:hypothetical protein
MTSILSQRLQLLGLSAALAVAVYATAPAGKRLEAETPTGEVFVIGAGETCLESWHAHGPIPPGATVRCVDDL